MKKLLLPVICLTLTACKKYPSNEELGRYYYKTFIQDRIDDPASVEIFSEEVDSAKVDNHMAYMYTIDFSCQNQFGGRSRETWRFVATPYYDLAFANHKISFKELSDIEKDCDMKPVENVDDMLEKGETPTFSWENK